MQDTGLRDYIINSHASGISDQEIKDNLLSSGWSNADINEALGHIVPTLKSQSMKTITGKGKRLINFIVDTVCIYFISYIFSDQELTMPTILAILIPPFYYIIFEGLFQKTLGKLITGTKVLMENGSKPDLKHILGRTFARMIPFEPLSVLFNTRGWHDTLSKTIVVPKNYSTQDVQMIDANLKTRIRPRIVLIVVVGLVVIAVVGIFATVVLVSLNSARSTARDNLRVAHVKIIQGALDVYYFDNKQYPSQLTDLNPIMMEIHSKPIPSPVMPVDGDCTEENNQYRYVSTGNSYTLSFCLGETIKEFTKGVNMVKPN